MDEKIGQGHDVDEYFVSGFRKVTPEWILLVVVGNNVGEQDGQAPSFAKCSSEEIVGRDL